MKFYRMLSENYSEIFPLSDSALRMVIDITPDGGRVLDVGAAKGELVRALIQEGYDAFGLEYVPELIGYPERTIEGDMHKLPFEDGSFDTVVCMGNTLVHSDTPETVIAEFSRVLKKEGRLLIQILNYDRILENKPSTLPVIECPDVRFERKYEYYDDHILFKGEIIKNNCKEKSSVKIYLITSLFMTTMLNDNKLHTLKKYGGFEKTEFTPKNSYSLVVISEKGDEK